MTATVTSAQIKAIAGKAARADLINAIVRGWADAVRIGKITTPRRAAHFLAEIMTETGGLQILSESGAYRYETILKIFGVGHHSAKITPDEARRIAALPIAQRGPVLFNRVYGTGNPTKMREFNNTGPNDGWLYRGGGMMQCTGKSNYAAMAKKTGMPLVEHPELLHNPDSAFKAAYLEWAQDGRCNAAADRNKVEDVRRIINGGQNGIADTRKYLATALNVLRDYDADDAPAAEPVAELQPLDDDGAAQHDPEDRADPIPMPVPRPAVEPPPNVQPLDPSVRGDPVLFDVQQRLKRRRYPPGILDGKWGGGTSGALSGFMNDRGNRLDPMPTSLAEFHEIADQVRDELQEAETEVQPDGSVGWYRPVTEARAKADPKIVNELAPETVPSRRNFITAAIGSIGAFFTWLWNTFGEYVSKVWDFFTDHQDDLEEHPEAASAVWGYVSSVPTGVWIFIALCVLGFITFNAWRALKTSTLAVQRGERQ